MYSIFGSTCSGHQNFSCGITQMQMRYQLSDSIDLYTHSRKKKKIFTHLTNQTECKISNFLFTCLLSSKLINGQQKKKQKTKQQSNATNDLFRMSKEKFFQYPKEIPRTDEPSFSNCNAIGLKSACMLVSNALDTTHH